MRAEEAFEQHFDPAVHIARLEDTQYADKLLKCLNDGMHQKLAKANLKGLQTDMREALGPDRWNIRPAQSRRDTINRDLAKLAIACDDPYNTGEYLIGEEVTAAMSEEAVLFEKVNAVRNATEDRFKEVNARMDKVEKKVEEVESISAGILKMMENAEKRNEERHAATMSRFDSMAIQPTGRRRPRST